MSNSDMRVIEVIEKALVSSLAIRDKDTKSRLIELLEICQDNVARACLNSNNPETAENMRQFYQALSSVIEHLKYEDVNTSEFFDVKVKDLLTAKFF